MHDVLLCIGTGKFYNDPKRMKFSGEEFYVKTVEEMARIFPDHPEALENTVKVVETVEDVGIELGKTRLPNFPKPEGYTADQYLREQCERGLVRRYGGRARTQEVRRRLEFELETIGKMGFADYFLIVWDFVSARKTRRSRSAPAVGRRQVHRRLRAGDNGPRSPAILPALRAFPQPRPHQHAGRGYRFLGFGAF